VIRLSEEHVTVGSQVIAVHPQGECIQELVQQRAVRGGCVPGGVGDRDEAALPALFAAGHHRPSQQYLPRAAIAVGHPRRDVQGRRTTLRPGELPLQIGGGRGAPQIRGSKSRGDARRGDRELLGRPVLRENPDGPQAGGR